MNIAILITSFNRVKTTISALRSLYTSINKCNANNNFDIYLVDDKSPDNTGVIVKEIFPDINVIIGSGNLFWGGGTNLAWETATSQKEYDGFIWFNDDCELFEDSLSILLNYIDDKTIIGGAFKSQIDGKTTYGGKLKSNKSFIVPNKKYQNIDLLNGNLVYIPNYIFQKLGYIDKVFKHGNGDYDYGLRAKKNGFFLRLTPVHVGVCERHDFNIIPCFNKELPLLKRLEILYSPRYSPYSMFIYRKRHYNIWCAIASFFILNIYAFIPFIYIHRLKRRKL